jgi:hypothetical protein
VPSQTDKTYLSYTVIFTLNPQFYSVCVGPLLPKTPSPSPISYCDFSHACGLFFGIKTVVFWLNVESCSHPWCLFAICLLLCSFLFVLKTKLVPLLTVYSLLSAVFLWPCFGYLFLLLKDLFSPFYS